MMRVQDIYSKLMEEHKEVEKIMKEIDSTTERGVKTRENLFMELREHIVPHMKSEEKVLYPVLLEHKELKELTFEGFEEHDVAIGLLRQLDLTPKSSEKWHAKFSVFMENVLHHVDEEENQLFPKARKVVDGDVSKKLSESYEKEEERQKNSLIRRFERKVRAAV